MQDLLIALAYVAMIIITALLPVYGKPHKKKSF